LLEFLGIKGTTPYYIRTRKWCQAGTQASRDGDVNLSPAST
jgi:hypothetical protein